MLISLLLTVVVLGGGGDVRAQIPQIERDALLAFYDAAGGPGWKDNNGWDGPPGSECSWTGITCENGGVTRIDLCCNDLSGVIAPELGSLSQLRVLNLPLNSLLQGSIPPELGSLANLEELHLQGGNGLSGPIPPEIGTLERLRVMNLSLSGIDGPIPSEIGGLSNLEILDLGMNRLGGALPEEIWSLAKLVTLNLKDCGLGGELSPKIGQLKALRALDLSGNSSLKGPIPSQIGMLSELRELSVRFDYNLEGPLPQELFTLSNLEILDLGGGIRFGGELPVALWQLKDLRRLRVDAAGMSGTISAAVGDLTKLEVLDLSGNQLSGEIPVELGQLPELFQLFLSSNELEGEIPAELGNLPRLQFLSLEFNRLEGPIPLSLTGAPVLRQLILRGNALTGEIPEQVGGIATLGLLDLSANQLEGEIPPSLSDLPELFSLNLSSNLLEGEIPSGLGSLPLFSLNLARNSLRGDVPESMLDLATVVGFLNLEENALSTSNDSLRSFLDEKGQFTQTQTIPPGNVQVESITPSGAILSWEPIDFSEGAGGYQLQVSTVHGGPYTPVLTTPDKRTPSALITGLQPATSYHVIVKSISFPHGGGNQYQLNTVFSDASEEVEFTTLSPIASPPQVLVAARPRGMVQKPDAAGGSDRFTLVNVGGEATQISLAQDGAFFAQSPTQFTLGPGGRQVVEITGLPAPKGEHRGSSLPTGVGVPANLEIEVVLLSAELPATAPSITTDRRRIDLVAPSDDNPSDEVVYTNVGSGTFNGVVTSDVEFLVPPSGVITIPPGTSLPITVQSDRSKRPDASLLAGSQVGRISLISLDDFGQVIERSTNGAAPPTSLVTVVDTVKPATKAGLIPPLEDNEVALFIPHVGHVDGSVGTFISDLVILNSWQPEGISDLRVYYLPVRESPEPVEATLPSISLNGSVALSDVVKSVFDGLQEVGTIQIRSRAAADLSVSASIFNSSNPAGNFGTAIPVFRSDRGARPGEVLMLTGLRKDESGHTNVFLQEMSGTSASVRIEFLSANGAYLGGRMIDVAPFSVARVLDGLESGTVTVRVRNLGAGTISAYATPVDRVSGDTWAVADWAALYAFEPTERVVIPVAGAVRGANDTDFRTDVAVASRCESVEPFTECSAESTSAVLRYYARDGSVSERKLTFGLSETIELDDVVRSTFGVEGDSVGYLELVPDNGSYAVSSRTYTLVSGSAATFGSTVPAFGFSTALRLGQARTIGGLSDTSRETISRATPATSRTNAGIVEIEGRSARVRLSIQFADPRQLTSGKPIGVRELVLEPRGFVSLTNLVEAVIGSQREQLYGDLFGVQVRIDHIDGEGAVLMYTSSVDNGTGDSVLRTD